MNIGIFKIGANITQSTSIKTASNWDIFSLAPILVDAGHTVRIITKITRNTKVEEPYRLHELNNIKSLNSLDLLLVFNGSLNFFGGADCPELFKMYKLMAEYKGPIVYVMTDCRFPFLQLNEVRPDFSSIEDRSPEQFRIDPSRVYYLYQGVDRDKLLSLTIKPKAVPIPIEHIRTFPMEWAIMLDPPGLASLDAKRTVDLIYGGAARDATRKRRFEAYYTSKPGINIRVFGSISKGGSPAIPHTDFIRMMTKSKATVIIGDKFYENNFYTLRMFESIIAGCVTYIDKQFDSEVRNFYAPSEAIQKRSGISDEDYAELQELYVTSQDAVIHHLRSMTEEKRKRIVTNQYKHACAIHGKIRYKSWFIRTLEQIADEVQAINVINGGTNV